MNTSKIRYCLRPVRRLLLRGRNLQSGQALVELGLVIPLLCLLLVGAVEWGRLAFAAIEVSNAAMAGVQYGSRNATTAGDTTGIQTAAANDAVDITLGTTTPTLSCTCSDGSSSTCQPTDCSGSHIETILTVQTQTTFDPGFHLPGFANSYTLYGLAVQKVLE